MTSAETASFALDTVHRLNHRLDSIQDRLLAHVEVSANDRRTGDAAAAESEKRRREDLSKLESALSQASQPKALLDAEQISRALDRLRQFSKPSNKTLLASSLSSSDTSPGAGLDESEVLELIAATRLTYATYGLILDNLLKQAEKVNDQAWYWQEVEEDVRQTVTYFVQTLPIRVVNLISVLSKRIGDSAIRPLNARGKERSEKVNLLNRDTVRQAWKLIQESPNVAIGALFPLSIPSSERAKKDDESVDVANAKEEKKTVHLISAARIITPLGLTRHEARAKRAALSKERDTMATQLGALAQTLSKAQKLRNVEQIDAVQLQKELWERIREMQKTLDADQAGTRQQSDDLVGQLQSIVTVQLSRERARIDKFLSAAPIGLGLPSRLAHAWPVLLLGPVTAAVAIRMITRSWDTIVAQAMDARETVKGFLVNWVYDPCIQLLNTIRTGEQSGVLVSPESLNSDLQSLERMVTDFSQEQYGMSGAELDNVTARVREGDLTTVLKIYEKELKSPLRSAVSGSLIRALLIQIQKVKVDIAVAMRGVDQLLKSQQLLFGAIGIAPAMAILYVTGGFVRSRADALLGGQGKRVGQSTRYRAWEAMRRIDRLLSDPSSSVGLLSPLTQGLLLLDLALLRKLAPQLVAQAAGTGGGAGKRSTRAKRLRAEFLQDVRDLEMANDDDDDGDGDGEAQRSSTLQATAVPGIGWHARRAAVDRMWKSWGGFISI